MRGGEGKTECQYDARGWRANHLSEDIASLWLFATVQDVLLGTNKIKWLAIWAPQTRELLSCYGGSLSQPQDLSRISLGFSITQASLHTPPPFPHQCTKSKGTLMVTPKPAWPWVLSICSGLRGQAVPSRRIWVSVKPMQCVSWVSHVQGGTEPCISKQDAKCQHIKEGLWAEQILSQDPTWQFPMASILGLASLSQWLCEPAPTSSKGSSSSFRESVTDITSYFIVTLTPT